MLLDANCISRCRVTENMGYMQELECRVKGKIPPEIKGLCIEAFKDIYASY